MEKIKKGDQVVVLSGRDKGRRGSVVQVTRGGAVLVEGINKVKRHTKPNPQANQPGGIIEKEMPMPLSKVMLICKSCNKPVRVGFTTRPDGKHRVCRSCGQDVD